MSNEFKDWERDKIETERYIVEKYPFLRLRNGDGTVDTSAKFPMIYLEIPDGWINLFLQMCEDLKEVLIKEGLLDTFYLIQVKEKYNKLVCYCSTYTDAINEVRLKYQWMASYICCTCGKPATYETKGYIESFCDNCWKDKARHRDGHWIEFNSSFNIKELNARGEDTRKISFENEWNRYLGGVIMDNFNYLKSLSREEFARWLDENGQFDGSPWIHFFDKKYCKNCPAEITKDENGREHEFAYCELYDNKCKYFPNMNEIPDNVDIIKMWLEEEV